MFLYLGIDFLITQEPKVYVVEVNVGLPGGAHEYDLTHLVHLRKPSDIFSRIEATSQRVYGKPFREYLHSLPFIENLKVLKLWMDGMGPYPSTFHPGLRLEDKWIQYNLLKSLAPLPETRLLDPENLVEAAQFLKDRGRVVLKRRVVRGGRGLQIITRPEGLRTLDPKPNHYLLQEHVESKIDGYTLSIRAVAFGGEFMCMYANLSTRPNSNHGILAFVSPASSFGLHQRNFGTQSFNQKSWEAKIWFGDNDPPYLRHNLYEEEVAETRLHVPRSIDETIREMSVKIERFYEGIDLTCLPKACFEN
jgi:hypothetical protein